MSPIAGVCIDVSEDSEMYIKGHLLEVEHTKMKGIMGRSLPRSHMPPTAMAQTVASNTSWNSLKRMAGMVPTGSLKTPMWKTFLKPPKTEPPSP